jgi:hypothetical protein
MPLIALSTLSLAHEGTDRPVDCVAFSRDGTSLFVGRFPTVFVVRVSDGAIVDELDVSLPSLDTGVEGDDFSERVRLITESPDGATLYVLSEGMVNNTGDMFGWVQAHERPGGARLWMLPDVDDPNIEAPIDEESGISFVLPMPDGAQVALCSTMGVYFADARTGDRRAVIEWNDDDNDPYDRLSAAVCTPDGAQLWLAWPPDLRCYNSEKKLVRRIDFTDVSLASFDSGPPMAVRPSDGRVTVIRGDRSMLVVANESEQSASVTAMNASGLAVLALIEHGDRWLRATRAKDASFVGPIAVESREKIRVLEESDDGPKRWRACAVHEGSSLTIARAHGSSSWLHRVVED